MKNNLPSIIVLLANWGLTILSIYYYSISPQTNYIIAGVLSFIGGLIVIKNLLTTQLCTKQSY